MADDKIDKDKDNPDAGNVHTLPLVKAGPLHGKELEPASKADPHSDPHAHEAGHDGADHVPHVLPLSAYVATWLTLMVLTVVTVAASYFNFGGWNFVIAIVIATTKAVTVAAVFMHLRWDKKFHTVIFSFSLIFLAIFIAFTMYDTETRGRTDIVEADRPITVAQPFAGGKAEMELKERYEGQPIIGGSSRKAIDKVPVLSPLPATAPETAAPSSPGDPTPK